MIALLPLYASCDAHDIAGISASEHPDTTGPTVFIYDAIPGGVGITEAAFERIEELLAAVADRVSACPCDDGCPSCVQSPECGNGNLPMDKAGAVSLARWLCTARTEVPTAMTEASPPLLSPGPAVRSGEGSTA
jgi:DEAD/DEAH box helicase domain-containing protein